jgi:hypothetical protein
MLNLDDTFERLSDYNNQNEFLSKSFFYSVIVLIFVEILREQLPEVNLLQLIPGFYLFFLFSSFFSLLLFSNYFGDFPTILDRKKVFGTKTIIKLNFSLNFVLSFILFVLTFVLSILTIIPISLDSFNSYGEKTLENIWSFDEVIGLEIVLAIALFLFSQLPLLFLFFFNTQRDFLFLQKLWKIICLGTFLIAGFATPTIDGYTQLSFSLFGLSFYLVILIFLIKRKSYKIHGIMNLNF